MSQPPVALVTGAARGIGLAIAQSLIAAGYRVMAADLGADQAWNYELGQSSDIAQALQTDSPLADNTPPSRYARSMSPITQRVSRPFKKPSRPLVNSTCW